MGITLPLFFLLIACPIKSLKVPPGILLSKKPQITLGTFGFPAFRGYPVFLFTARLQEEPCWSDQKNGF
jgi:hypothetical protein